MLAVLLAMVLAPLAPSPAMAADDGEVRRELEKLYQERAEAFGLQDNAEAHYTLLELSVSANRLIAAAEVFRELKWTGKGWELKSVDDTGWEAVRRREARGSRSREAVRSGCPALRAAAGEGLN
ncbi:MAG: hypothetical protein AAB011_11540 [Candidatus Eisenbacteria bacterium]